MRSLDKTSEYRSAIASQSFYDSPGRTGGQKPGFLREDALQRADLVKNPVSLVGVRPGLYYPSL